MRREDVLNNIPMFAGLKSSDVKRLAKWMGEQQVPAGAVVIKRGDQATGFFIVVSGKLQAVQRDSGGGETLLASYGPGDFFGEMALFEGFPRSATVTAIEDSECLLMSRRDFMAELKVHPQIAVGILPVLVRRLRDADARISE